MNDTQRANIYKCMADETRLSILRKLAADNHEVRGSEIIDSCSQFHKLSQPAMSHHFQKLVTAGIISERKVGVEKFYQLNKQLLTSAGINAGKL